MTKKEILLWDKIIRNFMSIAQARENLLTLVLEEENTFNAVFPEEEGWDIIKAASFIMDGERKLMSALTLTKKRLMEIGIWEIEE